jgi:NADH-quinone oxidoreductase subunit J
VIVYAGAIVVLFLFTLMMLDMRGVRRERFIHGQIWLGIPLAILLAVEAVFVGIGSPAINQDIQGAFPPATVADLGGSTQALAAVLFSEYLLPFEVASVLLLVGAVGAIILARRYERVELEELDAGTAWPSAAPITDGADSADQPTEHAVERGG